MEMSDHIFRPTRRTVLAGLGAAALGTSAVADDRSAPALRCKADTLGLRPGQPGAPVWSLAGSPLTFKRGDAPRINFANDLPAPVVLNWRGIDGVPASEPLLSRLPLRPSDADAFQLPLRHAGTCLCDIALLGDGAALPTRALPLIVAESEPVPVDRDEVLLIEGWRLTGDSRAVAPATEFADTTPVYTVNGELKRVLNVRANERLRLRFINGLQRTVIALKIEGYDPWVMALDGQPAEPFQPRNGALPLAPGGRADVFVDATATTGNTAILMHDGEAVRPIAQLAVSDQPPLRPSVLPPATPLPSNGLPARLDLKSALRVDFPLGRNGSDWVSPAKFVATGAPAFQAKAGRAVVLSLANQAGTSIVFHLHGHHFRLLDRLDDGWKPFWLDTIAIEPGQTQRIAFAADHAGRWLMEAVETRWTAPKFVRWFSVE